MFTNILSHKSILIALVVLILGLLLGFILGSYYANNRFAVLLSEGLASQLRSETPEFPFYNVRAVRACVSAANTAYNNCVSDCYSCANIWDNPDGNGNGAGNCPIPKLCSADCLKVLNNAVTACYESSTNPY